MSAGARRSPETLVAADLSGGRLARRRRPKARPASAAGGTRGAGRPIGSSGPAREFGVLEPNGTRPDGGPVWRRELREEA